MQQYIDQAIFDSGVLVLGVFGILELEKTKSKFQIENFLDFNGLISSYQKIRPNDALYRVQTQESLEWLLSSVPINLSADEGSMLFRSAYELRKELNPEMQPPSMREKIFRGAIFQPESKNYINRVAQSKINIAKILCEISNPHNLIFRSMANFERRLSVGNIQYFIAKSVDLIVSIMHNKNRQDKILWETKFHFACLVAASCYMSAIKRFESFPIYNSTITSPGIASVIRKSICEYSKNNLSARMAELVLDHYISDIISKNNNIIYRSERRHWEYIVSDLNSSKYAEDEELWDFFEIASYQIDSYDFMDAVDVDLVKMGSEFLNG
jgi:hypothetical protein